MKSIVDTGFADLSRMNFDVSDEQRLVLDEVDRACRELRPFEDEAYLAGRFNQHLGPIFKKAQLLGLPISRRYGDGQGADVLTYALALERIGREGTGVRTFLSGHVSLGQVTIQKWASEEQKQRYLPPATRGERIMCFGLTEPTAGSDPASLRTTFEDKGVRRGFRMVVLLMWLWFSLTRRGRGMGCARLLLRKASRATRVSSRSTSLGCLPPTRGLSS